MDNVTKVLKNHTGKLSGGAASIIIIIICTVLWPNINANTTDIITTKATIEAHTKLLETNTKEHLEIRAELKAIKSDVAELKSLLLFLYRDDPKLKEWIALKEF